MNQILMIKVSTGKKEGVIDEDQFILYDRDSLPLDRRGSRGPTHVPKAEAEEKPQSTHGQGKIRDYVHKLPVLLRQHNARIAF